MFGAPEIRVVVSEEVHVSVMIALRLLGFARERLITSADVERSVAAILKVATEVG
jgi:glutamate/tyrosine decarboxylase-like PLP-dependent enzyme